MTLVLWSFKIKILISLMASCSMMSCCSTSSPWWPRPWSTWWQRSLVYLLGLHPLRGHLLRAKLNESKPSWGTYPTMVAELISGKVWIERWQKIWSNSNFLATHSCGRSTSTWLSTAFSPSSSGDDFDLDLSYISRFYLVWFPVFYGKKRWHDS